MHARPQKGGQMTPWDLGDLPPGQLTPLRRKTRAAPVWAGGIRLAMRGGMSNRSLVTILLLGLSGVVFAGLLAGCDPMTIDDGSSFTPPKKADQVAPDMAQPPPPDLSPAADLTPIPPDLTCGAQQFQLERI